jgi:hypothetical protein
VAHLGQHDEMTRVVSTIIGRILDLRVDEGSSAALVQPPGNLQQAVQMLQETVCPMENHHAQMTQRLQDAVALAREKEQEADALRESLAQLEKERENKNNEVQRTLKSLSFLAARLDRLGCQVGQERSVPGRVEGLEQGSALCFAKTSSIEEGILQLLPGSTGCNNAEKPSPMAPTKSLLERMTRRTSVASLCSEGSVETEGTAKDKAASIEAADNWEEDKSSCSLCGKSLGKRHFSLARRHHCRACGKCVCSACSPHLLPVADHSGRQRVCIACAPESATLRSDDNGGPVSATSSHSTQN